MDFVRESSVLYFAMFVIESSLHKVAVYSQ
jgi:hypothetical protein